MLYQVKCKFGTYGLQKAMPNLKSFQLILLVKNQNFYQIWSDCYTHLDSFFIYIFLRFFIYIYIYIKLQNIPTHIQFPSIIPLLSTIPFYILWLYFYSRGPPPIIIFLVCLSRPMSKLLRSPTSEASKDPSPKTRSKV